jgi:NO-binding membrane sensor protein with MHYT domain
MLPTHTPISAALGLLPFAGGWGACFAAWFTAFELMNLRRRGATGAMALTGAAGLAAGAGVWAQPSLVAVWPAAFGFDPLLTLLALAAMVGAAIWGLSVERLYPDPRGLIGGGAILGAGVAITHGVLLFALRGPMEIDFGSTPIATAVGLASTMAVGGLMIRRRRPGRFGQLAAVVCLTAATTASQGVERAAIGLASGFAANVDPAALPAQALTPIAGLVIVAVLAVIALWVGAVDLRPATRARAWRGSSPPAPSPSRAGTGSPRPTPFR